MPYVWRPLARAIDPRGTRDQGGAPWCRVHRDHDDRAGVDGSLRRRGGVWANTRCVPEYGREYTGIKWAEQPGRPLDEVIWERTDFDTIAAEQTRIEEAAAREGSPLLICDADAFATAVWEHRYLGDPFTIADLRHVYEAVWDRPLDPANFRRKILATPDVVLPSDEAPAPSGRRGGRPSELYRRGSARFMVPALYRPE